MPDPEIDTFRLWPGRAPGATSDDADETPKITVVHPPSRYKNGAAVVIAPGGAYVALAHSLEGTEPATWFASRGVTAFVLTYRVGGRARLPLPLIDGARAMRLVRSRAAEFGLDADRIGMMGFSAGGHLAATIATSAEGGRPGATDPVERASSRPDFLILGYPWLEGMQLSSDGNSQYCEFARRKAPAACDPRRYTQYLPTRDVSARTPPAFLYHTTADQLVPSEGSLRFYLALKRQGVPAELHLFERGSHGSGLGGADPALSKWPELLQEWLRGRGLLDRQSAP
ncbi:alpha/beta hydrolase [Sphingomonas sp. MG17]|uniref:Alpha/beta hydrolase n=1 Tax=Sphingomonas tagetis TaxID=2949092 RepID=A0A9X2KMZ5_9SPHN|nr:alpha/beta hydrolase [Sphingomonas tagetis]MCP3732237.1 alpha/beta hydrolase [Sphingomonas tagetis]